MGKETANKVLLAVCSIAKPGEYVILSRSELAKNLPADYRREDVDNAMLLLQADDYVAVRYSDGDVYCLSVLTKGYVYGGKLLEAQAEQQRKQEQEKEREKERIKEREAAGAITGMELFSSDEEESPEKSRDTLPAAKTAVRFPWKRLFFVCATGAFFGSAIAGVIITILVKIVFR